MNNIPFYPSSIPIVFATDNNYVPYMSVMIQSVMENASKNRKYVFHVLHKEITDETISLIKTQISSFSQFSIEFINVTPFISKYNFFISRHISVEAYFRLLIPELFSEYHKVIYLDDDMVCCTDIAELFDINIENYLLAAVRGMRVNVYYSNRKNKFKKTKDHVFLNYKNPYDYFNSGMCVFNNDLFRKTISCEKLLELASSRDWHFHDQDVLNYIAEGKTLFLPYCWNFISTEYKKNTPLTFKNEYMEAEKNPKILHYKPWDCANYVFRFELFWKYATRTPFIEIIIERMKKKGLTSKSFLDNIISNIMQGKIGLKFILFDCVKAWLFKK